MHAHTTALRYSLLGSWVWVAPHMSVIIMPGVLETECKNEHCLWPLAFHSHYKAVMETNAPIYPFSVLLYGDAFSTVVRIFE